MRRASAEASWATGFHVAANAVGTGFHVAAVAERADSVGGAASDKRCLTRPQKDRFGSSIE